MAEVFDSELNGVVQEYSYTACESLITDIRNDAVSKKPTCALVPEEEENICVDGGVLEKRQKGVCEVSEMAKKKGERLDFCGDDREEEEGSVKCALKIELIDDTALIVPVKHSDISQRNMTQEKSDVKGKRVVGLAEYCKRNGNNKRNVVQESDGNAKRIAGFGGNLELNGNEKRNVMQECDGNGKRIACSDGNSQRIENEKGYVIQEGDGNGKGIVGFGGNLHRNGNGERNLMQESGGNGKGIAGSEESLEKNVMQESEGKKEKRPRRRGKKNDGKKKSDEKEKMSTLTHVAAVNLCREGKMGYSRKEMEALRFVDVEEQKKRWVEVYCGLGPEIAKEYDGLVDSDNQKQKHIHLDFDPRHQFGYQRAPSFSGDSCSNNANNETRNVNSLEPDISLPIDDENSCPIADEEFSDDDDSDEYESILKPAFLVSGEPDFDSGPPQDGLEYLRRVRWEASQIPKVKVSRVDKSKLNREQTAYMPQIPEIAKCPEHLLPLKQWEDAFIADFSELRLALSRYEGSTDELLGKQPTVSTIHERESACELSGTIVVESFEELTPTEDPIESSDVSVHENSDNQQTASAICESDASDTVESSRNRQSVKENLGNYPTLSTILGMDSVAQVSMLRKRISALENVSSLSKDDCLWLFALCAAVDTPLDPDTSASFRSLLRKCASLRTRKAELDDEVIMLNILATISGRYFGQSEN